MDKIILKFIHYICEICGIEVTNQKAQEIIKDRIAKCNMKNAEQYIYFLQKDKNEFSCLISAITNHESYFMREHVSLDIIVKSIIPEILTYKKKIKILSFGCAKGEEIYSLVWLCQKWIQTLEPFFFMGIDIDTETINEAKKGIYSPAALRSLTTEEKKIFQYIHPHEYKFPENLTKKVHFKQGNLLDLHQQDSFDIILCRNVLVHFNKAQYDKALRNLSHLLSAGGVVFFGQSEIIDLAQKYFKLNFTQKVFFYQKCNTNPQQKTINSPEKIIEIEQDAFSRVEPKLQKKVQKESYDTDYIISLIDTGLYFRALQILEKKVKNSCDVNQLICMCLILQNNYIQAQIVSKKLLCEHLEYTYLCEALLYEEKGELENAIKKYRQAIYYNPNLLLAQYYLILCLQRLGLKKDALCTYSKLWKCIVHSESVTMENILPKNLLYNLKKICEH